MLLARRHLRPRGVTRKAEAQTDFVIVDRMGNRCTLASFKERCGDSCKPDLNLGWWTTSLRGKDRGRTKPITSNSEVNTLILRVSVQSVHRLLWPDKRRRAELQAQVDLSLLRPTNTGCFSTPLWLLGASSSAVVRCRTLLPDRAESQLIRLPEGGVCDPPDKKNPKLLRKAPQRHLELPPCTTTLITSGANKRL